MSPILFPKYGRLFAYGGIAIMGFGGLSVLLGLCGRVGGAMLAVFLVMGAMIHFLQMGRVDKLSVTIKERLPTELQDTLTTLTASARLAHYSSALKNLALAAVAIFFAMVGTGPKFNLWSW